MERGLIWLPLLAFFFWLAWQGWNEYQKVESYQIWSQQFDQAKYDIYSVLGKKDLNLTWGKPTRKEPIDLQTFSLQDVSYINLLVDNISVDSDQLPSKGYAVLDFGLKDENLSIKIPFTEIDLAAKWQQYLQTEWRKIS